MARRYGRCGAARIGHMAYPGASSASPCSIAKSAAPARERRPIFG
jgi:hypothetical protein